MRILLVNPPNTNELQANDPIIIKEQQGVSPPLGLLHIASYLTRHEVRVVDCQVEKNSLEDLRKVLDEFQPEVVGMTVMTFTLRDCLEAVNYIRNYIKTIIVLGGPHPTIYPEETLELFKCDYVVVGEGEVTFKKLLKAIPSQRKIWHMESFIKDLDTLPFPDRTLLPYQKYYSVLAKRTPTTTMFSSRGCPFQCTYCDRPALGKQFRAMSAKRTVDEMEYCANLGIKEIFFYDDTFTVNKQRVLDICKEIKERGLKISWDVRSRVDTINEEMIKAMKGAGCVRIHFGVESSQPHVLKALRKGINKEQVKNAFRWCKKHKMKSLAYFMIGNPEENDQDIVETAKFARKLKPDYMQCTILTPFPATQLYRDCLTLGMKDVWKEYSVHPTADFKPPIYADMYSREELQEKLRTFYKKFYLTPSFILGAVLEIRNLNQLKRYFKAGLSLLKMSI